MKDVPQMPVPDGAQRPNYMPYVVGYFDILGMREALSTMAEVPWHVPPPPEYDQLAARTLNAICEFRRIFNVYYEQFLTKYLSDAGADDGTVFDAEIRFQCFSDTAIVYIPLLNHDEVFQWPALHALTGSCTVLVANLLSKGWAVRGALELGGGCEFVKGEIFGPVLQQAYVLEAETARYPRVVIGDQLAQFVLSLDKTVRSDPRHNPFDMAEVKREIAAWIAKDRDGCYILDYLGTPTQEMKDGFGRRMLKTAYAFVCAEHKRFQSLRNTKVAWYYAELKQYFESRGVS